MVKAWLEPAILTSRFEVRIPVAFGLFGSRMVRGQEKTINTA